MKFTTALAATLFGASALAAPAKRQDSVCYQIKDFTERKYDGKDINTVFFDILSTPGSGGNLDFECSAYDPVTDSATQNFESGHVYACGKNSQFSFSFYPGSDGKDAELNLWQEVSETKTYVGTLDFPEPTVCHAGGSTAQDEICEVPDSEYEQIDMTVAGSSGY